VQRQACLFHSLHYARHPSLLNLAFSAAAFVLLVQDRQKSDSSQQYKEWNQKVAIRSDSFYFFGKTHSNVFPLKRAQ
jgi:hypothetical protein